MYIHVARLTKVSLATCILFGQWYAVYLLIRHIANFAVGQCIRM